MGISNLTCFNQGSSVLLSAHPDTQLKMSVKELEAELQKLQSENAQIVAKLESMAGIETKCKEKLAQAVKFEAKAKELEHQTEEKEEELVQARDTYEETKQNYDELIKELNEM